MKADKPAKTKHTTREERVEREVPVIAYSMELAARALGCSTPTVYMLVDEGYLTTFTVGRKRYTTPRACQTCVDKLEAKGSVTPRESGFNHGNGRRRRTIQPLQNGTEQTAEAGTRDVAP
jgi:excisionase family DNA binding protein